MLSDLNRRLQEASERAGRLAKLERRCQVLEQDLSEVTAKVQHLKRESEREGRDVTRLEGSSLTGLFYSMLGSKEEQLKKERQEALAAQLKYQEAVHEQEMLTQDLQQARREREALTGSAEDFQRLLQEKEQRIGQGDQQGSRQLNAFMEREQAMQWELRQVDEAAAAGMRADSSLQAVEESLSSAQGWGTWDMLGGGLIATAMKHSRIDDAQAGIHRAQHDLATFRRELADVQGSVQVQGVDLGGFGRFADYFFDGLIVDWVVQNRINDSRASVQRARTDVSRLLDSLEQRRQRLEQEAAEVARERLAFVEQYGGGIT